MRWTSRQVEMTAEIAKSLGLVAVPGGVADAVVSGAHRFADAWAVGIGVVLLIGAVWLIGKVDDDKL